MFPLITHHHCLARPEGNVAPGHVSRPGATVSRVRPVLVVEATTGRVGSVDTLAVDIHGHLASSHIMHGVQLHGSADLGDAGGDGGTASDTVQTAGLVDGHHEVRPGGAVESLLEGDAIAAQGVDLELARELMHAGAVVVRVSPLGAEVAVGTSRAAGAAVGLRREDVVVAVDVAARALLDRVAGADLVPSSATDWAGSEHGGRSGSYEHKGFEKHD